MSKIIEFGLETVAGPIVTRLIDIVLPKQEVKKKGEIGKAIELEDEAFSELSKYYAEMHDRGYSDKAISEKAEFKALLEKFRKVSQEIERLRTLEREFKYALTKLNG